jgi:phosphoadenosine phosphosulfate reductase
MVLIRSKQIRAGIRWRGWFGSQPDVSCLHDASTFALTAKDIDTRAAETRTLASRLEAEFPRMRPVDRLKLLRASIDGALVFTTSLGLEDQALTHLAVTSGIAMTFVTLDTGRLFPETHAVWAATEQRYGIRIRGYYPQAAAVEKLVEDQGIDGFYHSQAARKSCCEVRKVAPLGRALQGARGWITGLRADQSGPRHSLRFASYDPDHGVLKVNPLLDWSRAQVGALVASENIPVNPLHDCGFLSIGCAPCTRAVAPGEPERAGRWWWENDGNQECGLHLAADGRLLRRAAKS